MPKKVENRFSAEIRLNAEKGGAWLATIEIYDEAGEITITEYTAWKNASACKRWVKERVRTLTPRKSIPFLGANMNDKNKPTLFSGSLTYKIAS